MTNQVANTENRMDWLDGARLAAAFCIVGIHISSDSTGGAFKTEDVPDRVFPVLFRAMAEIASSEFFFLISLFLLSFSLAKSSAGYIDTMLRQARRLLVPFLVWTLFYAFFRLYKAYLYGYEGAILAELSNWVNWMHYLLLGSSMYHMHFLPTLFLLLLFHRVFKLAIDYPLLGLIVVPMTYLNDSFGEFAWRVISDPILREYCMRLAKVVTYTGYGFFAYALYGFLKRDTGNVKKQTIFGLSLFLLFIGILIKAIYAYEVVEVGEFIVRREFIYYGHFLFPCLLLIAFYASQYLRWPVGLSNWSKYGFGIYLIHPAVIDIVEISFKDLSLHPTFYIVSKYLLVAFISFGLTVLIGKTKLLAWIIGLGRIPFFEGKVKKSVTNTNIKIA